MHPLPPKPVFGIVAGEVSGDTLGAGLIRALKKRYPGARFVGICGPQMLEAGGESWFPMERLSVMGLVEVLGRIRELFAIRDELQRRFIDEKIDCFIGIDAPDFNLRLAPALKVADIPTVHYVSPSVWAWRQGRIHKIKASVDLMLCLLPFEKAFYDQHDLKAVFVGHPLADSLPLEHDVSLARQQLGLPVNGQVIALLPGSRGGEVSRIAPVLFEAAKKLTAQYPDALFIIPAINSFRREQISVLLAQSGLQARIVDERFGAGVGRLAMGAADLVIMASGTATLEAMLLKRAMVVIYKLHWLTYLIARLLVHSRYFSLPNLLAGETLVPELLQGAASPEGISAAARQWLDDRDYRESRLHRFADIHRQLQVNGSETGAEAIQQLLESR
ncbi:lipid-A-disaccharide synthase [Fluviicoccus keumensis]|uniref:Lipid-A-disaccharide synthase n=1 Tax=Fluviicoccus keumensis TaxID=1435465 RepID=A0A4V6MFY4_9GAMM|nr:lipid-A-disaccharide synthase [Fluviicoccus keumensis]RZU44846.1 lipid-A-disaccharide synthase [Fluviicoccus keumensis]